MTKFCQKLRKIVKELFDYLDKRIKAIWTLTLRSLNYSGLQNQRLYTLINNKKIIPKRVESLDILHKVQNCKIYE